MKKGSPTPAEVIMGLRVGGEGNTPQKNKNETATTNNSRGLLVRVSSARGLAACGRKSRSSDFESWSKYDLIRFENLLSNEMANLTGHVYRSKITSVGEKGARTAKIVALVRASTRLLSGKNG